MKILVATDGTLDPGRTVEVVQRLTEPDEPVHVLTVVSIPHSLLDELERLSGGPEPSVVSRGGAVGQMGMTQQTAEQLVHRGRDEPVRGPSVLEMYLKAERDRRTGPLVKALRDAGLTVRVLFRESDGRTARSIIDAAEELGSEMICIGAKGRGAYEGKLGATATKLVRQAPMGVVVVR